MTGPATCNVEHTPPGSLYASVERPAAYRSPAVWPSELGARFSRRGSTPGWLACLEQAEPTWASLSHWTPALLISVPHGLSRVQMLYAARGRPSSKLPWAKRTSHRMRQVCVRLCPGQAETNVPLDYLSTCTPTPAVSPKACSPFCSFSYLSAASFVESLQRFFFCPSKLLGTAKKQP
jgi:hypothetical protein